ncbi:MAG: YARHG domain-containing protein, partial [Bacillus sp. (in: firmicutes)]
SSVFFSSVASYVPVSSEFIFPGSNIRRLTESEIEYLSLEELSLARNEIFARHGRIFKTDALQYYFEGKSWYNPDPYYDDNLSNIETYNVNLIKKREEFLK